MRDRRRLVLVGAVLAIVLTGLSVANTRWQDQVMRDARVIAARIEAWSETVSSERLDRMTADAMVAGWEGRPDPFTEALDLGDDLAGIDFGEGAVSLAFRVTRGWSSRCVHALVEPGDARIEITSGSCQPRQV